MLSLFLLSFVHFAASNWQKRHEIPARKEEQKPEKKETPNSRNLPRSRFHHKRKSRNLRRRRFEHERKSRKRFQHEKGRAET